MVLDNIEATFEFDPCRNYLVTPRLPVQDVTRQQYEMVPWTHTNIMKLSNILFLFSWVNFRSVRASGSRFIVLCVVLIVKSRNEILFTWLQYTAAS